MRVRLCVSLTLPIVVCESPHNGVFIDPGKMTGSIFAFARRTCVLDASADTSKLPIGVCIRTVCVYRTHTRAVHVCGLAARMRARVKCHFCPGRKAARSASGRAALTLTGPSAQKGQNPGKWCKKGIKSAQK